MNKETDKELLELAAKASGIEYQWMVDSHGIPYMHNLENGYEFDPLNNDGDAFRLAVQLEMLVDPVNRVVAGYSSDICIDIDPNEQEEDSYGAVRKAIVRAAAEIGKGMK